MLKELVPLFTVQTQSFLPFGLLSCLRPMHSGCPMFPSNAAGSLRIPWLASRYFPVPRPLPWKLFLLIETCSPVSSPLLQKGLLCLQPLWFLLQSPLRLWLLWPHWEVWSLSSWPRDSQLGPWNSFCSKKWCSFHQKPCLEPLFSVHPRFLLTFLNAFLIHTSVE